MNILKNNIMNLRAIEHRRSKSKLKPDCIVEILSNGGHYSAKDNWKYFGLDSKYQHMSNVCINNNIECIVIDHFYHPEDPYTTILVIMQNRYSNDYMIVQNNSSVKLIKGKFPSPNEYITNECKEVML